MIDDDRGQFNYPILPAALATAALIVIIIANRITQVTHSIGFSDIVVIGGLVALTAIVLLVHHSLVPGESS